MATTIAFGQVGINTTTPQATLDVVGKKGATDKDGFIAPRLTRAELTAKGDALYGASQNGAIIFITDITGGNSNTQRVNITQTGYYYFDASNNIWSKLTTFQEEPWKLANTNYATSATTAQQNIAHQGNVSLGNPNGTGFKLSIMNENASSATLFPALTIFNNTSEYPAGKGVKITLGNSNDSQFMDMVNYNADGDLNHNAFGIRNTSTQEEHLTLEYGFQNPFVGNLGLGTKLSTNSNDRRPSQKLDVNGNARIRSIVNARDDSSFSRMVVAKNDGTLGYDTRITNRFIVNENEGPRDITTEISITNRKFGFPIFVTLDNTGCVYRKLADLSLYYINRTLHVNKIFTGLNINDGNGGVTVVSGDGTDNLVLNHKNGSGCGPATAPGNDVNIQVTADNKIRVISTTNNGFFRYTVNWLQP